MTTEMPRSRLTRRSVLVLIAAVLVVGIAALALTGSRTTGPLAPSSATTVEFQLAAGQSATWGSSLPVNPTAFEISLQSIEPIGVTGLEVLGIQTSQPGVDGSIVNALGFPPAGIATAPVAGSILQASGSAGPELQILIGVRLTTDVQQGAIEGLRVRYVVNGAEHEVDLPYGLRIVARA